MVGSFDFEVPKGHMVDCISRIKIIALCVYPPEARVQAVEVQLLREWYLQGVLDVGILGEEPFGNLAGEVEA
jgi:hypothetical protein